MDDTSTNPRLLIVEDDEAIIDLLVTMLARESFDVSETTTSAEAALAVLVARDFDVVILDDRLDGPTRGVNIVPMIRELRPRTKIILFSATAELTGNDVDAALSKFDIARMVPTIRTVLGLPVVSPAIRPGRAEGSEE